MPFLIAPYSDGGFYTLEDLFSICRLTVISQYVLTFKASFYDSLRRCTSLDPLTFSRALLVHTDANTNKDSASDVCAHAASRGFEKHVRLRCNPRWLSGRAADLDGPFRRDFPLTFAKPFRNVEALRKIWIKCLARQKWIDTWFDL